MKTETFEFLLACQTIGGVCGSNGRYQAMLAGYLPEDWRNMRISELLSLIDEASGDFNKLERRLSAVRSRSAK